LMLFKNKLKCCLELNPRSNKLHQHSGKLSGPNPENPPC